MNKYILKIGNYYIRNKDRTMGVPSVTSEIGEAWQFTEEEYLSFVQMICLTPEIIRI